MITRLDELINKYSRPGPRYTSYPPVPFWTNPPSEESWIKHLSDRYDPSEGLDLYVHVPYCESLCYYCGCNRTITKDHSVEDAYVELILREWSLYEEKLGHEIRVNSIHFGGGTPTFLSPRGLGLLIGSLTLNRTESFIGSIEIDPRTCEKAHLRVLKEHKITRVSLGIQDFDPVVQAAIHRRQPEALVESLVAELRAEGFASINFDLIYGLPKQTLQSIEKTLEIVARLNPDLIAFYGYAHLPEKIKNQKLIKEADLPDALSRQALYAAGKSILARHGFEDVGLDHFARPGSYLLTAKRDKKLHRNFMGYVDKKSPVLLGLGPTSISDSSLSFAQNAKELTEYESLVRDGNLPIAHGHTHTSHDLLAQEMILRLMCTGEVNLNLPALQNSEAIMKELEAFEADGIVEVSDTNLRLTDIGRAFMRNVAMTFDHHLRERSREMRFSKTL